LLSHEANEKFNGKNLVEKKMPVDRASHLIAEIPDNDVERRTFCRSFVQFLFSNLGLVFIVVAYSIGGAFLFTLLEQYIELQNCQQGSSK
jgi:hypothetical protein